MKGLNMTGILLTNPMDILSENPTLRSSGTIYGLGLPQLTHVFQVAGIFGAIVMIFCAFIVLLVVNYPKTVSQTKTKVVHSCIVVALIASLPFLADVVLTIIIEGLF